MISIEMTQQSILVSSLYRHLRRKISSDILHETYKPNYVTTVFQMIVSLFIFIISLIVAFASYFFIQYADTRTDVQLKNDAWIGILLLLMCLILIFVIIYCKCGLRDTNVQLKFIIAMFIIILPLLLSTMVLVFFVHIFPYYLMCIFVIAAGVIGLFGGHMWYKAYITMKSAKDRFYQHQWNVRMGHSGRFDYVMSNWQRQYCDSNGHGICFDVESLLYDYYDCI
eukprot:143388_1